MDVIVTKAERSDRRSENRGGRGRRTYGIARAMIDIVLLVKLYRAAALLKFLQEIKILEPLTTMASGVFTASVYSFTMKVSLVVALVVSYAVHEFGHFFATKIRGLTANWWIFFPFAAMRFINLKSPVHRLSNPASPRDNSLIVSMKVSTKFL